ncbi:LIVCS family branched-chain amino acid:cation transporter [Melghirimyces profundicolus]|uniref:Branched-chain amino acid transport system carrier protein n=1 Tax=Melghirimyces profundicolus TaxID=1242148 RepID=A0A2T6BZ78_9BACL|nr:branched-chain amino acid transport system II carrier protein [Melghirimyces profundicolus]PTX61277.1 LIVCS family branched-chain amino acid:cation transporter [Melghirimyces profundicolus]
MTPFHTKDITMIGLMLLALFFGAGNMIFPPALGQAAGIEVWPAMAGFVFTAVGLPLLGVIAIAVSGGNLQTMAGRVHPWFGVAFTVAVYFVIGPLFGTPRTATVAFEMGAFPFLPEGFDAYGWPLFLYTLIFFAITFWLALNPSKLVNRIGKILTPLLLVIIGVLLVKSLIDPAGPFGTAMGDYKTQPFFRGFMEGYLTMDTLGALVFGIVVIRSVKERTNDRNTVISVTVKAGLVAALGLTLVYLTLGYLGATSQSLGMSENGGQILTSVVLQLFGHPGVLLLGTAVTLACLTTSVGLVTSSAFYFSSLIPGLDYKKTAAALCIAAMVVANMGLTQIIAVSIPVLTALYPMAIVLILLSLFPSLNQAREIYGLALIGTALVSFTDGLKAMNISLGWTDQVYGWLPFYSEGIGWLLPGLLGALIGYAWHRLKPHGSLSRA